jgi:hypothetical protein
MYFWKTKNLEFDLSTGSLSQSDKYKYLLAFMIITAVCMELSSYISELPSFIRLFESSVVILITIIGTMFCHKINRQGDNADFIDRYICLFLPIFIRLVVFIILIFSLYMILGFIFAGDSFDKFTDSTNWVDVIFTVGLEVIFYWKLSVSIRKVAMSNIGSEPVT